MEFLKQVQDKPLFSSNIQLHISHAASFADREFYARVLDVWSL